MGRREVFAGAVREEMYRRGWNQSDVADHCRISEGTVSNVLRCRVDASPGIIGKLTECFGWSEVTLNRLFYGEIDDEKAMIIEQIMHRLRDYPVEVLRRVDRTLTAAFEEPPESREES